MKIEKINDKDIIIYSDFRIIAIIRKESIFVREMDENKNKINLHAIRIGKAFMEDRKDLRECKEYVLKSSRVFLRE